LAQYKRQQHARSPAERAELSVPIRPTSTPTGGADTHVVIACAADSEYVIPLAVTLKSALATLSAGATLSAHVVDAGMKEPDRNRLSQLCVAGGGALVWHDANSSAIKPLPLPGRMTMATYHRLALARLLPAEVRKVIWLDSDVVVADDLQKLWRTDLADNHLVAVPDPCVPYVSSRYGIRRWRELGLDEKARYFNAGVMLIDLDRWRQDEIGERAGDYLRERGTEVMFWDQEGLNAVLSDRWGELDVRWNFCPGFTPREQPDSAGLEPAIVHFAGTLKPWLLPAPSVGPRALFYKVLDETPWAGWRPRRTATSVAGGWYESSRLRDLLYPAEHWLMLYLGRRLASIAKRRPRRHDVPPSA
jgi:lipopolysaccharide biosynthesis glycosyltransferase